jgi:hypothetical protein
MNPAEEPSQRLERLAQIIAESSLPVATSEVTNPVDAHIESVPLERIRRLTSELTPGTASAIDEIDGLTMRLLLNEYSVAVAHLREATRLSVHRIAAAAVPIQETRRRVREQLKGAEAMRGKQERSPTTPKT